VTRYVFHPSDAFPFRERQIVMAKPVASNAISRNVFKPDELVWIDGWVADIMGQPDMWVRIWVEFTALRATGLQVKFTRTANRRGWPYSSKFLAWFSVQHTVVMRTLQAGNRPALAAELGKHPYEIEVLRGNRYTGSAVNGVLAESGGPMTVPVPSAEPLIRCAYCGLSYKQSEPRCTHCGAGH
jgi:hypothetical protein